MPTFFMRLTLILSFLALSLQAQDPSGEEAIAKVFAVLSGAETKLPSLEERNPLLQKGAWEALAYIDRSRVLMPSAEDLMEAVPDYYHFKKDYFLFKLINPKNHNEYGFEGQLKYRWEKRDLVVLSRDGKEEKDRWTLLYLDENYLALKMGDLYVFFTKTRPLEH